MRSISHSLGRFLAIAAIVALGTGFYAGLRMTAPDMELSADAYYDGTALYDIRVLSTMGLTDDDVESLGAVEGVRAVMPAYEVDAMSLVNGEQTTMRIHSLDVAAAEQSDTSDGVNAISDDAEYLNRPLLVEGSWPSAPDECVVSADVVMATPLALGDTIELTEGSQDLADTLVSNTFTITGFVRSSYYTSTGSLGTTSLGSGALGQYLYVSASSFAADLPYTEAYVSVSGAEDELGASDAYAETVLSVLARIEDKAPELEARRLAEVKQEAQDELDENREAYERERADADTQLAEAKQKLDDAKHELDEAKATLDATPAQLDAAAATIAANEQTISSGQADFDAGVQELENQRGDAQTQFDRAQATIDEQQVQLDTAQATLAELEPQLVAAQQQLANMQESDPNYAELAAKVAALDKNVNDIKTALGQGIPALEEARSQLAEQRQSAQQQFADAQTRLDSAAAELESGRAQLEQGRVQLTQARQTYEDGKRAFEEGLAEYEDGLSEYERQKAEADEKLADAKKKLDDAQAKIDDIEAPEFYVMDRTKNVGAESFKSDAQRVDQIAQVFPFIFFLVAALVALTTMTRMVEDERVLIGTFKALGYGKGRISFKYLAYAGIASGAGALIGIGVLSQVLPAVIMNAYGIIYEVPGARTPIDFGIAALSAGLGIGVTLVATAAAVASTLRERPATLMLPRAPKAGKRILLERIGPLWRRTSFSWKVTFRNIFRYKKRFFMTLIGIAGCTALLLTGLGLSDAINDIIAKQFGQIYQYNTTIGLVDDPTEEDTAALFAAIDDANAVEAYAYADTSAMTARAPGMKDQTVHLVVPEDPAEFQSFVTMRERVSQQPLDLTGDEVFISEKLATVLGVGVGDEIELAEQDAIGNTTDEGYAVTVTGIMENYVSQYVFMTPEFYERVSGEDPLFSTIFAKSSSDPSIRSALSDELLSIESVKTVGFNDETIDSYEKMLGSVNSIVVVLVVAAAALAFVVLYNLTNINITERKREIATLKVLGFTPREVDAYIFREIMLLTVIGCAVGLVFGVFMENFVVVTAEVDQIMFGREIHAASFALAFLLTMAFAALVALAMRRKLAKIDMVESLKSNE
ncbi:FtsX-like permease family protein [Raoultibacter phocaeensis]|uniref:FtsX-like permease family protein n=1 Tax=Raoultibacter phocaeensis TaxID=2479841 RepID=UPI002106789F|nr:FtsX-like permease family protein [Raoultibacter phocaeensis]